MPLPIDKRSQRKANTKTAIMQAALQIAEHDGWAEVTIRKIADKVLYSPPVIYEYFQDKDDLLRQLVHEGFNILTNDTMTAIEPLQSPESKLIKIAEVRFDFAEQNQALHNMMFSTERPEWQKKEIIHAMSSVKQLVFQLLHELNPDQKIVRQGFVQLIGVVVGFTYMNNHIVKEKPADYLGVNKVQLKHAYLDIVSCLINRIKDQANG